MPNGGLDREVLHQALISALNDRIVSHSDIEERPLEIELEPPLPAKLRVYLYTVTEAGGSRPPDEYNIQVFIPGVSRGESGTLNHTDDRLVILAGYYPDLDVFILWDAYMHSQFSFSETVQVKQQTIEEASREGLSTQTRHLSEGDEIVVGAGQESLDRGFLKRVRLTTDPLPEGANPESEPEDRIPDQRAVDYDTPETQEVNTTRIIRDTGIVNQLKEEYEYRCQICDDRRKRDEEIYYAEGHHLKPLKNEGPDEAANILILCPNHHADFDYGMIKIDPDTLQITHAYEDVADSLTLLSDHEIDEQFLEYNNDSVANF